MKRYWTAITLALIFLGLGEPQPSSDSPHGLARHGPSRSFFVSPSGGGANDGSIEHPLDLATALSARSPARAGDTIWLRDGTYLGSFTSALRGQPEAPIIVRAYPGERPIIDSRGLRQDALYVAGDWTWFWGFELTNSDPLRVSALPGSWPTDIGRGSGISTRGSNVKFINLVVHDLAGGLGIWSEAVDTEAYGNLVYYNGWDGPDRSHGHGIYTQNRLGVRRLRDNIIFGQFGHGIHAYGTSTAYLNDIQLEGNVLFDNGSLSASPEYDRNLLVGGERQALRPVLRSNVTYYAPGKTPNENNVGYSAGCAGLVLVDNYFVRGNPLNLVRCNVLELTGNHLFGTYAAELPAQFPQNTVASDPPSVNTVFVRPNLFEQGRATIVVFNWEGREAVDVDLSSAGLRPGEQFVIRDAQDYFGSPVMTGSYRAGLTQVPLTRQTVSLPVGQVGRAPVHTAPEFAVFIVLGEPRDWPNGHRTTITDAAR